MLPGPCAHPYFPSSLLPSQSTHFYASQDGNQSFPWALGPRLNLTASTKARRTFPGAEVIPVCPHHVSSGKGSVYPTASLIYTSSSFRGSSSINKASHREVISGSVTSLTQSILTQPSDESFPQQSLSHKSLGLANPNPNSLWGEETPMALKEAEVSPFLLSGQIYCNTRTFQERFVIVCGSLESS